MPDRCDCSFDPLNLLLHAEPLRHDVPRGPTGRRRRVIDDAQADVAVAEGEELSSTEAKERLDHRYNRVAEKF